MEDFRIKYRPRELSELWGNDDVKNRWERFRAAKTFPKAIVLYGNHGTGKTTLARIFAQDILSVLDNKVALCDGFHELDSTQYDSDSMRRVLNSVTSYRHGTVVFFFDEFQRMPLTAQEILLKPIEDTDEIFFIFAATDLGRLDTGILSRSTKFVLNNPPKLVLLEKLAEIAQWENIGISKEALEELLDSSKYSPRECLGNLQSLIGFGRVENPAIIQQIL